LILVEGKAHATELRVEGKIKQQRKNAQEQARTDANHEKIGKAISEVSLALQHIVPGISLTRDRCYQFANRIAFSWKLASMRIPVAIIYLGFIGDVGISSGVDDSFSEPKRWRKAFAEHTAQHFPVKMRGCEINCDSASFWLLVRELQVLRQSPPVGQRSILKLPAVECER